MKSLRLALAVLAALSLSGAAFAQRSLSFAPDFGVGGNISATTTSSSITLSGGNLALDTDIAIANLGTVAVNCRWGVGAQTALTTDVAIPAGQTLSFGRGAATVVACITASGTATVNVSAGVGIL
jgi:hypothetical protein